MPKQLKRLLLAVSMVGITAPAWSDHIAQHKNVNGMDVYYGIVPAQVVQAHIKEHGQQPMHKKSLFAKGAHHLVVTLYDARTSQRITDATITATVTPLGLSPESKSLEIMKVADELSYGNYFNMPSGDTPYRIDLSIRRPTEHLPAKVQFEYKHQTNR